MEEGDRYTFFIIAALCLILVVLGAWMGGVNRIADAIRSTALGPTWQQAIDHGHAHYDPKDGTFKWNDPAECGNERNGE